MRKWRYLILVVFSLTLVAILLVKDFSINKNRIESFSCKANMVLTRSNNIFRGIVDHKINTKDGIVNVNGFIVTSEGKEYLVKRTIILSMSTHGGSPVWYSSQIVPSAIENVPESLMKLLFTDFFYKPGTIADVDILHLSSDSYLIIKSNMPHAYCSKLKI